MGVVSSFHYWEILNHYGYRTHILQIIVNTVLNWWMSDLNIRPHPIPTKVSRIFDRVIDKALSDKKNNIEVDGLVGGEVEKNPLSFFLSFTPLISYFLLSHAASGLHLSQTQESELPKDLPKGFTRLFKKLLESCWSWKRNLTCAQKTTCHNRCNHLSSPLPSLLDRAK